VDCMWITVDYCGLCINYYKTQSYWLYQDQNNMLHQTEHLVICFFLHKAQFHL